MRNIQKAKLCLISIEYNMADIVKEIYEQKLDEQNSKYNKEMSSIKKVNTKLLNDNKILNVKNSTLSFSIN